MARQLLRLENVRAPVDQRRDERVPQRMRGERKAQIEARHPALEHVMPALI